MNKLNDYKPETAHVKVSVAAMRKHLEALEAVADDPAKGQGVGAKRFSKNWGGAKSANPTTGAGCEPCPLSPGESA
jgi:hypothetical protein